MTFPLLFRSTSASLLASILPDSARAATVPLFAAGIPASLKDSFSLGLGVLFLIGFIWGVVNIWGGAEKMKRGDADGKMGIVSGIIIAGAAAIMGALFIIFGMDDGVLTPKF